jgi:hypothetical protein
MSGSGIVPGTRILLQGSTPIGDAWRRSGGPALPFSDPLATAARWEAGSWALRWDGCTEGAERFARRAVEILSAAAIRLVDPAPKVCRRPLAGSWERFG